MESTLLDVLIIDDEIVHIKNIQRILDNEGFRNHRYATRYQDAKKAIYEQPPDIIISDINLKYEKDGINLMEEINSKMKIPFMFITSHSEEEIFFRAQKTNHCSYITKPFSDEQMIIAIYILLRAYSNLALYKTLSERQKIVLKKIKEGKSSTEIGKELKITENTVETHRKNIFKKVGVSSVSELIFFATKNGWF